MAKNKGFKLVGKARPSPLGLFRGKKTIGFSKGENFRNFVNGWFFIEIH
jgi:hypothetical protein